jgi:hypothetical protein
MAFSAQWQSAAVEDPAQLKSAFINQALIFHITAPLTAEG